MSSEPATLERAVEATLFASDEPMTIAALAVHLGGVEPADLRDALTALATQYAARGVHLVERGGRWHFETAPD
ncbi:MAG: SMC-Scp complex subunit ScpB, partial [Alphaproteobacteria bacterium HGW-Alphaproteobacteria-9]